METASEPRTRSEVDVVRLARDLALLQDRIDVGDMLPRYAAAMDSHDADGLASLFAEEIVVEAARIRWSGRDLAVKELCRHAFAHAASHHIIAMHRVTLDGDRASAVGYFHSVHLNDAERPNVHEDHGGWYLTRFRRTGEGWRFTYLKQVSVWQAEQKRPGAPLTPALLDEMRRWR